MNPRSRPPAVNTHVHVPPNFSAFATAEEAVRLAATEGVAAVGTSNYHDFRVYRRFAAVAADLGVLPLFGIEIITLVDELAEAGTLLNDPSNPGRLYLCGKAITHFDPPIPPAARRLAVMRAASDQRMRQMAALVIARFRESGLSGDVTADEIAMNVAARSGVPVEWVALQERHLAQAFQELLFRKVAPEDLAALLSRAIGRSAGIDMTDEVAVQEAIRSSLMKAGGAAFVPEAAISFDEAHRLILELGGIPCYPILADGASPVCPFEASPEVLAEWLRDHGIHCAELIPGRNRSEVVDRYVTVLRTAGIVVVAGTEHNTRRMISMAPAARGGEPLSELSRAAFWEGACVVAAHQHLRSSGLAGYVDDEGRPAAGYVDEEARIDRLREVGEGLFESLRPVEVRA